MSHVVLSFDVKASHAKATVLNLQKKSVKALVNESLARSEIELI